MSPSVPRPVNTSPVPAFTRTVTSPSASMPRVRRGHRELGQVVFHFNDLVHGFVGCVDRPRAEIAHGDISPIRIAQRQGRRLQGNPQLI